MIDEDFSDATMAAGYRAQADALEPRKKPRFPPNRIIKEGEVGDCETCGSSYSPHKPGGERADHEYLSTRRDRGLDDPPAWFLPLLGVLVVVFAFLVAFGMVCVIYPAVCYG